MSSEYAPGSYGSYGESGTVAKNGAGVAGLVLGIVALLLSWIVIGLPLAIIGLVLSIIGFRRIGKRRATNRGVAITGLVINVLALLVAAVLTTIYAVAFGAVWSNGGGDAVNCFLDTNGDQAAVQACADTYRLDLDR